MITMYLYIGILILFITITTVTFLGFIKIKLI